QLIGELAENYELKHLAGQLQNLSLDDFRTIRSILEFVVQPAPAAAPAATEVVTPSAPIVETTTVSTPVMTPVISDASAPAITLDREEVSTFMVNFVVDQTGYPAEMVELDADLEADLGIDSIKKAQLIGELAEHLNIQIQITEGMSLDDFPTLRHVLNFLSQAASKA